MSIKNQLHIILKQTALSQERLAGQLKVSFATLNSWFNGKSNPRPAAKKRIEELYKKVTGEKTIPSQELEKKYQNLLLRKKNFKNVGAFIRNRADLYDIFLLKLTYNTNRIEGSTLTEDETASLLFNNRVLPNKTLVEQLEAKNHQAALNTVLKNPNQKITEEWILKLHAILMNGIREDAGTYRNHGVRILGAFVPTANHIKIPQLMKELLRKISQKGKNPIHNATLIHAAFEKIHPFSDGNGRIGRLILCAMLLKANFPPALIREENRRLYYTYLRKAQMEDDSSLLEDFLMDAVEESFGFMIT